MDQPHEFMPQVNQITNRKIAVLEELQPNFSRHELVAILIGSSSFADQYAQSEQEKSSGSHASHILKADKARERLLSSAVNIYNDEQKYNSVTLKDVYQNPQKYNLKPEDLSYLQNWVLTENLVDTAIEKKYGVMRLDNFRKRVVEKYLRNGHQGTLICLDVVGLKEFNSYSDETGDSALQLTADLLLNILGPEKFNIAFPELCIGRRGDEFYLFIADQYANEVQEIFRNYYANHEPSLKVKVNENGAQTDKPIIHYWRLTDQVNLQNFDSKITLLDEAIESSKLLVAKTTLDKIQASDFDPMKKYASLLQLLVTKRVSPDIIQSLINTSFDAFKSFVVLTGDQEKEILQNLTTEFNSAAIKSNLNAILQQIAFQKENQSNNII